MSVFKPLFPKKIEHVEHVEPECSEGCSWTPRMVKDLAEALDAIETKLNKLTKAFNELIESFEEKDEAPGLRELKSDVKYIIARMKRESQSKEPEKIEKEEELPKRKGRKI